MPYKIKDKEYTDEQLEAALASIEELQKTKQTLTELQGQVAPALRTAEKYNMDVDSLVKNAEGAFNQIFQLQDAGVLDEEGNVVKKKAEPNPNPDPNPNPKPPAAPVKDVTEEIVSKALGKITEPLEKLQDTVKKISDSHGKLLRERMMDKVQNRFPNMQDKDVSIALARATSERRDFWEVVEEDSKAIEDGKNGVIDAFVKEHNIDMEALNKRKEMASDSGSIADMILEGKKISRKGGENSITAKEAMMEFLDAQDEIGG